jgi:hypothetical protein
VSSSLKGSSDPKGLSIDEAEGGDSPVVVSRVEVPAASISVLASLTLLVRVGGAAAFSYPVPFLVFIVAVG